MLKSQTAKIMAINLKIMIVGIDIAKKVHWARIINYVGIELTKAFPIHNTKEDITKAIVKLDKLAKEHTSWDGAHRALLEAAGLAIKK